MNVIQLNTQTNHAVSDLSCSSEPDGSEARNDALSHHLSPRQYEVLMLMLQGLSRAEIARHLGLSVRTVDTLRARLMIKLNARSNSELAIKAFALSLKP
jgi:DNA-binding CsgD family transcriptional regulator